ncbi:MAG: hypothetical protein JWR77_2140, partial [Rhizorhabdus sp.]|nr:hypothetical protein [Rhizorhabdus sp.]
MFWQEYYNNWGGYLLYSPDLNLWNWGSTWWTSPNKPIFLLFSYPVFFTAIYTLLTALMRKVVRSWPGGSLFALTMIVCAPIFYGYNLFVDGMSVDAGLWNYVDAIGPVLRTPAGGSEPLLWPGVPFALFGSLLVYSLVRVDGDGHPTYLRLARPDRCEPGIKRETVRAGASMLWWNLIYGLFMTIPVNLGRELFGHPSLLVP